MLRRTKDDAGFTLFELMLSIAILGILLAALVGLMFATMTADRQTKARLDGTRAEQFSAVYFGRDVQGAQGADGLVANITARCGPGTAVLEVRGRSYDAATLAEKVTVVSYVFSTATVDGVVTGRLERRSCEAPVSPAPAYPLSPASTRTVARDLSPTAPSPVCQPGPCGATTTSVNLTLARQGADVAFTLVGTKRTT